MENKIELSGVFANGYGIVPKKLMMADIDKNIKLILCYMLSFTGGGTSCFPSIRKISTDLQMSTTTVTKYIKEAAKYGYISKSQLYPNNPLNHANKYHLLFLDTGGVPASDTRCPTECNTDVPASDTSMCQPVTQNNNNINNNKKNNKKSKKIDIPECLNKPDILSALDEFVASRKELKKPPTDYAIRLIVKKLSATPDDAVEMLNNSIESGWAGVFPLKKGYKKPTANSVKDQLRGDY